MKKITLFLACIFMASNLAAQTVSSFAEGMNSLVGISVNSQNEIFAIEHDSGKILKLSATGNPTEIATTGGYGGSIAIDSWDSIYVIEPFMSKFIKLGVDGTSQELGFFSDAKGLFAKDTTLYYTTQTSVIKLRKKDLSVIAEYTGFFFAEDITVDANNKIYVADRNDKKLYRVEDDSTLTVLASNIDNITGVAYANDAVYFTTYKTYPLTNKIMKYDLLTNSITDYITDGLNQPRHLAIDRLGNMFVTNGDGSILKISDSELLPTTVFFRDPYFKQILLNAVYINSNHDKEIQLNEASSFTGKINLSFGGAPKVIDFTGLEQFKNITQFDCWGKASQNQTFAIIDLSVNTKLETIWCSYSNIDELILPSTPTLTTLKCSQNNISELDISGVPNLVEFKYSYNHLPNIDLSNLSDLEILECGKNNITELNVSSNTKLKELVFYDNEISNIDLSNNPELTLINGAKNQLTSINLANLAQLKSCSITDNQLTELDFSDNTALRNLAIGSNSINNVDLSMLTELVYLDIAKLHLQDIDLTKNTELSYFDALFNDFTELDLSANTKIASLNLNYSHLNHIDLSTMDSLKWASLGFSYNLLSIDMRNNHNDILQGFYVNYSTNLTCIFVDDIAFCDTSWQSPAFGTYVETEAECNQVVSISELETLAIQAYPNPANDVLYFKTSSRLQKIEIFNQYGKIVAQNVSESSINISGLPVGLYFAKATSTQGVSGIIKVIKSE